MPVCHERKFIFFHIPRCGGTSFEVKFKLNRRQNLHGVVKRDRRVLTLHHLTPMQLLENSFVTEQEFESYFKFAVIRDPFDRMASDYCWQKRLRRPNQVTDMSFEQYLDLAEGVIRENRFEEKVYLDHFRPITDFCLLEGQLVMDDVLRLETLDTEIHRIAGVLGEAELPHLNHVLDYEHLRTEVNYARVYELYACDRLLCDNIDVLLGKD